MAMDTPAPYQRTTTPRRSIVRRGVTLIELLIVIFILLVIGGLVAVNLMGVQDQSMVDTQRIQFDVVGDAMQQFKLNMHRYPSDDEGLAALWDASVLEDEEDEANWRGPYLEEPVDTDQWGNELIYQYPGEIRGEAYFDIISSGPDGEEGTDDDITNHERQRNADGDIETDDDFSAPAGTGG